MEDARLDRHFVAHDAATLAIASICGAIGAMIENSLAIGMLMMGAVLLLGIPIMRVKLFRRAINRLALSAMNLAETTARTRR